MRNWKTYLTTLLGSGWGGGRYFTGKVLERRRLWRSERRFWRRKGADDRGNGATGSLGGVEAAAGGFRVWVMSRRSERAVGMFGPGGSNVEVVEGELCGVAGVGGAGGVRRLLGVGDMPGVSALKGLLGGSRWRAGRKFGTVHSFKNKEEFSD